MTKVLCMGPDEGEGGAVPVCVWVLPSETEPQFLGSDTTPDICSGRKTVQHPLFLLLSPNSATLWPPSSVFYSWTLYSTVLYLRHGVSFFLEYIMLQNASSLIFSQVDCNGGRALLQKPAKLYFLQRAPATIQTFG